MTKAELEQLLALKAEIKAIQREIDNLPVVADTVTGSRRGIPYDKHSIPIEGVNIKRALRLKAKLQIKCDELQDQVEEMEDWLDGVKDSEMRTILRLKFRNGLADWEIAAELGYDRSTVSGKIRDFFRLDEDSPKSPI